MVFLSGDDKNSITFIDCSSLQTLTALQLFHCCSGSSRSRFPHSLLNSQQIVVVSMSYSNRGQYISRTVMLSAAIVGFLFYSLVMSVNSSIVGSSQSSLITKRVGGRCRLYNTHSYNPRMLTVYSSTIEILL